MNISNGKLFNWKSSIVPTGDGHIVTEMSVNNEVCPVVKGSRKKYECDFKDNKIGIDPTNFYITKKLIVWTILY